jgi:hypothetical protein
MGKMLQLKEAYRLIKILNSKDATEKDKKDAENLVDSVVGKKTRMALTKNFTGKKEKEADTKSKRTFIKDAKSAEEQ